MIQSFQKFSQSRPAKIFLAIVALSFMAFFGGGSWFQSRHAYDSVAEVGPVKIGSVQFVEKLNQRIHEIIAQTQGKVSREALIQTGLPQMVLTQLIQEALLDLEAKDLGLILSDEAIRNYIHSFKAFQNGEGVFDRTLFNQVLRANNLSEDGFITLLQQDLIRAQLVEAITVGASLPEAMINRLFDAQYQYRQASMIQISPKDMPPPPSPSEKELQDFYHAHEKAFILPELRTLTVLLLDPKALEKDLPVAEEEIQAVYDAKLDTFGGKPLEEVRSLVVEDIKKEKAAEALYKLSQDLDDKIAAGSTLEEIAAGEKKISLLKLELVDAQGLGTTRTFLPNLPKDKDLTQEILETGFGLELNTDSPFSQSKNGAYYVVRVDGITPSSAPSFASIKNQVKQTWGELQQLKAAQTKAEGYVKAFNQGEKKVATMTLLPNLSLSVPSPSVNERIKALVCALPLHHAGMVQTPEGFAVIVVNAILPPSSEVKEKQLKPFREALLAQYKEDLVMAYLTALHVRYPVKINKEALLSLLKIKE